MHNAPLSFLIYLLYFKISQLLNCWELDSCVYDFFDSASALELNPEIMTLTVVTFCITGLLLCTLSISKSSKHVLYFTSRQICGDQDSIVELETTLWAG